MAEFCRACGASIPHRPGEGRCGKCLYHDPVWARDEIERLRSRLEGLHFHHKMFEPDCRRCREALMGKDLAP